MNTNFIKTSFPRDFLYEFQLDKKLTQSFLQECLSANIKYSTAQPRTESTEYGYPIVENHQIIDSISKCVDEIANECFILSDEASMKISAMWITKTKFMKNSQIHRHSFSIFSGLLYLDDSPIETIFMVEDELDKNYGKTFNVFNDKTNHNILKVKPELGKLIIWPSYIMHKIATNNTKETRYTLAFNTFFDGNLSSHPTQKFRLDLVGPDFL